MFDALDTMNFLKSLSSRNLNVEADESEREPEEALDTPIKPTFPLIDKLYQNFNVFFDSLELDESLVGCDYISLLRALCHNTTVRYVTIHSEVLGTMNSEEIRILLEVVAGMPKLEALRVHFLPEMTLEAKTIANVLNRTNNLRALHLFDLELSGDDYDMEPLGEAIERLTSLKFISLCDMGLDDREDDNEEDHEPISPDHIVSSLATLPMLEEVTITTRRKFEWGDDSLGPLCESKVLKSLKLKNIDMSFSQITSIAEALQTNESLTDLQLSDCAIDADGWRALSSILPENRTLLTLDLSQCETLDDDACFMLGSCMEGNTALKTLQLHNDNNSQVTGRGVQSLFRMLETNATLESLMISFDDIDSSGYKAAAEALQRNSSLKKLYLENYGTCVSTRGVVALAKVLESENKTLDKIAILFDGADNDGVLALAKAMEKNPNLSQVTFHRAEFRRSIIT